MIPFVVVKTRAGFAYVRPEHVVAINASDAADCAILMAYGVTIESTEPAEDIVARLEAEAREQDDALLASQQQAEHNHHGHGHR